MLFKTIPKAERACLEEGWSKSKGASVHGNYCLTPAEVAKSQRHLQGFARFICSVTVALNIKHSCFSFQCVTENDRKTSVPHTGRSPDKNVEVN